jgi:hypothetical protein
LQERRIRQGSRRPLFPIDFAFENSLPVVDFFFETAPGTILAIPREF